MNRTAFQTVGLFLLAVACLCADPPDSLTTLVSGLSSVSAIAPDSHGNLYIADGAAGVIEQWNRETGRVTTLISGLKAPTSLAVDAEDNLYFPDPASQSIREWDAVRDTVTAAVSVSSAPLALAFDGAGNLLFAAADGALYQWSKADRQTVTLCAPGCFGKATGLAVDARGNAYISDGAGAVVWEWNAGTRQAAELIGNTGLAAPRAVAVDALGKLYVADGPNVKFYDPETSRLSVFHASGSEPPRSVVVDPRSGVYVAYVTKIQGGPTVTLGTSAINIGQGSGTGTVEMTITPQSSSWTATSNSSWLTISSGSASGTGNATILFTYTANSGSAVRTGTLTIAGVTLTVNQAGSGFFSEAPVTALVTSGLNGPYGVAVDASGNVYFANTGDNTIQEWNASTQQVITLVPASAGLNNPEGVAVDTSGNVYIADTVNNAVKEWNVTTKQVTSLVDTGLNEPGGVAVDTSGNVYIADTLNGAIKEWSVSTHTVTKLVSSGLSDPGGVAVDIEDNVYIADTFDNEIKKYTPASQKVKVIVPASANLSLPNSVAVDGQGNVYIADTQNNDVREWYTGTEQTLTIASSQLNTPSGVAVDAQGNVYVADTGDNAIKKVTIAWAGAVSLTAPEAAGTDSVQFLPEGITAQATSDESWLTLTGTTNGTVSFSFTANGTGAQRIAYILIPGLSPLPVTQYGPPSSSLGSSAVTVSGAAGSGSVLLNSNTTWTAQSNASWLTLSSGSGSGTGNALIVFSYQANPSSAVRVGTLTIAGITFTVTQAGTGFTSETEVTALVSSGLSAPAGVAVDGQGNVYFADTGNNAIKKWIAATSQVAILPISNLSNPFGVAVDSQGNVYVANTLSNNIEEWNPQSQQTTVLVAAGLNSPQGVAVDSLGNVYIADSGNNAIKQYNPTTQFVNTLVSVGLSSPYGVAVDLQGNVYIADSLNDDVKKWTASTETVTTLVSSQLGISPYGVAVDGQGNVYFTNYYANEIQEWNPVTQLVQTLLSTGLSYPYGIAVSSQGNVYISDSGNNAIKMLAGAYLGQTAFNEPIGAGTGAVAILPASLASGATSTQTWLTITGTTGGTISFSFTANGTNSSRTAYIVVPGVPAITVNQSGPPFTSLGAASTTVGGGSGSEGILVVSNTTWTAQSNASWLQVTSPSSGSGNSLVTFSYAANPANSVRTGTLTIGGATFTVTQAGSSFIGDNPPIALASAGLDDPMSVAVDGQGNVYIANTYESSILEYSPVTQQVTTLVSFGLEYPYGVTVDGQGNVYIADTFDNDLKVWSPVTQQVTTLISSGLSFPAGLAVDTQGNVYIADSGNDAIKEWNPNTQQVSILVSPPASGCPGPPTCLFNPSGVAVDVQGNVYIADEYNSAIKEYNPATQQVTVLIGSNLLYPSGVAVDGLGNVFVADQGDNAIKEWNPATQALTILAGNLSLPQGVAVDSHDNVYLTQTYSVSEITPAWISQVLVDVPSSSGSGSIEVLPTSLSAGATSDSSWLTITGTSNGTVAFSYAANTTGAQRTAYILIPSLPPVAVNQSGPAASSLETTAETVGSSAGSGTVELFSDQPWTAQSNASWLTIAPGSASGSGDALIQFTYAANTTSSVRTGTLTIAGVTFTVTQAGNSFLPEEQLTPLVSTGLNMPNGVAVDSHGNVYIADTGNNAVKEWSASTQQVTTLVSTGLNAPNGVAVDGQGNVYIADTGNNEIKEWSASTQKVTILVSSGLSGPLGVASDASGDIYIADTGNNEIKLLTAGGTEVTPIITSGLSGPSGVAVDIQGNVYVADTYNNAVEEWSPVTLQLTTLISQLFQPSSVAVDGLGNVYSASASSSVVDELVAATGTTTVLISSGLSLPDGVAVDTQGNVYIADTGNNVIRKLTPVWLGQDLFTEPNTAGSGSLQILPATSSAGATSSQSWLTITGTSNGTVSFTFTANGTNASRTAYIVLPGLPPVAITQYGPAVSSLGETSTNVAGTSGTASVILVSNQAWTAQSNVPWIAMASGSASGTGGALVEFNFQANPGQTVRTGTLTIAGLTFTVNQAGSGFAFEGVTDIVVPTSAGLNNPNGVAVDSHGNVYIADTYDNAIQEWNASTQQLTVLVSTVVAGPMGVAVDSSGNVYIADTGNNAVEEWNASSKQLITLVSTGLNTPSGVAVDTLGNVYIADTGNNAIKEYIVGVQQVATLFSPGNPAAANPSAVAVDLLDNVYFTNGESASVWNPVTEQITQLALGQLSYSGIAVDGLGNVYFLSTNDADLTTIAEWTAGSVATVGPVNSYSNGLAVDSQGNLYFPLLNNAVEKFTPAYAGPTGITEPQTAGSGSAQILPASLSAGATSDQSWLTITGTANGTISFTFTANTTGAARTAFILIPGLAPITVSQNGPPSSSLAETAVTVGGAAGAGSVLLVSNTSWTAQSNTSWLTLTSSPSGSGNALIEFTYTANTGSSSRVGTLTIGGVTFTVTQLGNFSLPEDQFTSLVASGLNNPYGVAVDTQGNVYIADTFNNAVEEWNPLTQTLTTLVSPSTFDLNGPQGVAVDGKGNVYIADTGNNQIEEYNPSTKQVTILIDTTINSPSGIALDSQANIYIADTGNNAVEEWNPATQYLLTLVNGLSTPVGVAVDADFNVYIAQAYNTAIQEWSPSTSQLTNLFVASTAYGVNGVAVDGLGNVYVVEPNTLLEWSPATQQLSTLVAVGLNNPNGVAVDIHGNIYIADTFNNAIEEVVPAFGPGAQTEPSAAGSSSIQIYPPSLATGATSDQSWLTITGINSGTISFAFTANTSTTARTAQILVPGLPPATITQTGLPASVLEAAAVNVGSASGSGTVLLVSNTSWTAQSNAPWLQLNSGSTAGTGNAVIVFTYQANTTPSVRSGTFTIAGLTFSVTQAGSAMLPQTQVNTLFSQGLSYPNGVALDAQDDVYVADGSGYVFEWSQATQTLTTLISTPSLYPYGVTVDSVGNVYFSDPTNDVISQWNASTQLNTIITGVSSNGLAVDSQNNLYIADTGNSAILEWSPVSQQITPLLTAGLNAPYGVAVDAQGNVYIADTNNNAIKEWSPVTGQVTTLLNTTIGQPYEVAVDGLGNVYIAYFDYSVVSEWSPATQQETILVTGAGAPLFPGVAVDGQENLYITATYSHSVLKATQAFVGPMALTEPASAGSDTVQFLPPSLAGSAASNQTWLTITGTSNGTLTFSFTANAGTSPRIADLSVAGLSPVVVTQSAGSAASPMLGESGTAVGPTAGSGSVLLVTSTGWTAQSNVPWLTITSGSSGTGDALIQFSYAANTGATPQVGTLTIAGLTFTVTQAGTSDVSAPQFTTLIPSGLNDPSGVAVDGLGNVYIADTNNNAVKEDNISTQVVSPLVSTGLSLPLGVAVDTQGNVYIANTGLGSIEEWSASTQQVTPLIVSGLSSPSGVAVDTQGNVYVADSGNNAIKEWVALTEEVITLVSSGLSAPQGVAVDGEGNVYIADTGNNAIEEWNSSTRQVSTVVSSGLNGPRGVALDGQENIYIADTGDNAIKEWTAATQVVSTLVATGLSAPSGVAVDTLGNVYVADSGNNVIQEFTPTWVGPLFLTESFAAGSDSIQYVPTTLPVNAVSNQSWLTVNGAAGGVVSLSFTANTTTSDRTAQVTLLGQTVTVTQSAMAGAITASAASTPQTTAVGETFGTLLSVTVTNGAASPEPLAGVPVTFTAPSTGASVTFQNGVNTAYTNFAGIAVISATANGTPGSYTVSASVNGLVATANFALTNAPSSAQYTLTVNATSGGATAPPTGGSYNAGSSVALTATESTGFTFDNWTGGAVNPTSPSTSVIMNGPETVTANFIGPAFTGDVPPTAYYFDAVNLMSLYHITAGCGTDDYCPNDNVTRAEMAIFIVRAIMGTDNFTYTLTPYFTDVPPTAFGFQWIQKMRDLNITTGCGSNMYCPTESVTRAEMAVFIIRARYGASAMFTYPPTPYFADVPPSNFAFDYIQRMAEDGITAGCGSNDYCPNASVTRGEMAVFIVRGGFNLLLPATDAIVTQVSPAVFLPGQTATVTISGSNTNFTQNETTLNPIAGFTIGTVTVISPTLMMVDLTAGALPTQSPEAIYVTDPVGQEVLPNAISIQ